MSVLFFKMFLDLFILLHVCECFTFILVCRKRLYLVATEIRRPRYPGSSLTGGCEPLSGCWEPALCNCWASLRFPTHLLLMPSLFTTWWFCLSLFLYLNFLAWCLKGRSYSSLTAIFASVLWAVFLCLHTLCTFIKSSIWITAFEWGFMLCWPEVSLCLVFAQLRASEAHIFSGVLVSGETPYEIMSWICGIISCHFLDVWWMVRHEGPEECEVSPTVFLWPVFVT